MLSECYFWKFQKLCPSLLLNTILLEYIWDLCRSVSDIIFMGILGLMKQVGFEMEDKVISHLTLKKLCCVDVIFLGKYEFKSVGSIICDR